jgi:hypothetical protein
VRCGRVIAGITRIADFPLAPLMAIEFSKYLDYLVIGFETREGYGTQHLSGRDWFNFLNRNNPFRIPVDMFMCETYAGRKYLGDHFLEELLRRLDDVKPDVVLECETDAMFGPGFDDDLNEFLSNDYDSMTMDTEAVTDDGRWSPDNWCPHMRGYKWHPEVSYNYGGGCCRVKLPDQHRNYHCRSKLQHYPFFTKQLEAERRLYYGEAHTEQVYQHYNAEVPEWVKSLFT